MKNKESKSTDVWEQLDSGAAEPSEVMTDRESIREEQKRKTRRRRVILWITIPILSLLTAALLFGTVYYNVPFRQALYIDGEKSDAFPAYRQAGSSFVPLTAAVREAGYELTPADEGNVYTMRSGDMTFVLDLDRLRVFDTKGRSLEYLLPWVGDGCSYIRVRAEGDEFFINAAYLDQWFHALHLYRRLVCTDDSFSSVSLGHEDTDLFADAADAMIAAMSAGDYDRLRVLAAENPDAAVRPPHLSAAWWDEYAAYRADLTISSDERPYPDPAFLPPLHLACLNGDAEAVRVMVGAGADVNVIEDYQNRTPLGLCLRASVADRYVIADLLLEHGASALVSSGLHYTDGYSTDWYYHRYNQPDALCRSIGLLAEPDAGDEDYRFFDRMLALAAGTDYDYVMAISYAIDKSSIYAFDALYSVCPVSLNEPLRFKDGGVTTEPLLHRAVERGADAAFIAHLLDLGADKTVKDDRGRTAYEVGEAKGVGKGILALLSGGEYEGEKPEVPERKTK